MVFGFKEEVPNMTVTSSNLYASALSSLKSSDLSMEKSMEKLSSGLRINSAADDASGLAISEKMGAQITSLKQASANAEDAVSFLETADGYLSQSTDIVQKMRELVLKAQNTGVLTESENKAISSELASLRDELDRIGNTAEFNTKKMFDGSLAEKGATFQIGASADSVDSITVKLADMTSKGLAETDKDELSIDISSQEAMNETLKGLDNALQKITDQRATIGATENRLEYTMKNLSTTTENLSAAQSRIKDVDMAQEIVNYTKQSMLNKVSISMLSQANSQAKNVLSLLGGL